MIWCITYIEKNERKTGENTDRQTDRGTNRQTNRQTDRQTDRQTEGQTEIPCPTRAKDPFRAVSTVVWVAHTQIVRRSSSVGTIYL